MPTGEIEIYWAGQYGTILHVTRNALQQSNTLCLWAFGSGWTRMLRRISESVSAELPCLCTSTAYPFTQLAMRAVDKQSNLGGFFSGGLSHASNANKLRNNISRQEKEHRRERHQGMVD